MARQKKHKVPIPVQTTDEAGNVIKAAWTFDGKRVSVVGEGWSQSEFIGSMTPEATAHFILVMKGKFLR